SITPWGHITLAASPCRILRMSGGNLALPMSISGSRWSGNWMQSVISCPKNQRAYTPTSSRMERMAAYTFRLLDGCGEVEDETGVNFGHPDHAIRYARDVVHELMRNRELETRSWRLDVYENSDGPICTIPFASIDPTLDHLTPNLRTMVEAMSERQRLF